MDGFTIVKFWLMELIDISLLLVSLGITVHILFGIENIPFIGNVTSNLIALVGILGGQGLFGLIAIVVMLHSFKRRSTA